MSSLALVTQELHKRNGEKLELQSAIEALEQQEAVNIAGSLSLSVTGCKSEDGKAVEESKLAVVAEIEGKTGTKKEGKINDKMSMQVSALSEILLITCYVDKISAGETPTEDNDEEGVMEKSSVVSIPFMAKYPVKDAKDVVTCEIQGSCSETSETMFMQVKVVLDETGETLDRKKKELSQVEKSISALQESAKAAHDETVAQAKKEKGKQKADRGAKAGGADSASVAKGPTLLEMGAQAATVAYGMGTYLVFGGAVAVIYLYGDYASI